MLRFSLVDGNNASFREGMGKMHSLTKLMTAAIFTAALLAPATSQAVTNMLFILDGSNSMWGQIDGQTKIKAAQDVLTNLLTDLPEDTKVGLMVYGHRDKSSCDDIQLISALGADSPEALSQKIKTLQPTGKTPIAGALHASLQAFAEKEGQNNNVVLISDGVETCNGNPCAAAGELASANIHARVHVVGFDVGKAEREQLECIPKAGKGKYFSASNASELKVAVAEVKQVAQAAKAPEAEPTQAAKLTEYFRDDFDGEELATHWEVINPDPDAFIVEDGGLLMLAGGKTPTLATGKTANVFKLSTDLPKGDWQLSATMKVDFQTEYERAFVGLYQDAKNFIIVQPVAFHCGNWSNRLCFGVEAIKATKGKTSSFFKRLIWEKGFEGGFKFSEAAKTIPQPLQLRLVKEGRKYRAGVRWNVTDPKTKTTSEQWLDLENFTLLRQKGKPAVGIYQTQNSNGESVAVVDSVKIEVAE